MAKSCCDEFGDKFRLTFNSVQYKIMSFGVFNDSILTGKKKN